MNSKSLLFTAIFAGVSLAGSSLAAAAAQLPMERPITVAGVRAACTGAGTGARDEPRWKDYRVRFEAVGGYGQYLGNELLTVKGRGGATFVQVSCAAPWVLMHLPPGRYAATMHIADAPDKSVHFAVAGAGQRDVIVRFPSRTAGAPQTKHLASNARQQTKL